MITIMVMIDGMRISDYRQQAGKSLAEMAADIGVSVAALSRYESGRRRPRPDVMARIHEVTGGAVTPNDFFSQDGEAA